MVISACVSAGGAEETVFSVTECDAEIIGRRVDGIAHVDHVPSTGRCHLGPEEVQSPHARMAVGCKIQDRISTAVWKLFVAWSIDKFSKVFQRAGLCFQVKSPQIETAGSSRHIG